MKKKNILIAIALICMLCLIGGTIAGFTREDTSENVITASSLDIELIVLENVDEVEQVISSNTNIMPGNTKSRIIKIKNISNQPAWIRVEITLNDEMINDDLLTLGELGDKWSIKDGYYYYQDILQPGDTTTDLCKSVTLSNKVSNEYSNQDLILKIDGQATQSKNNGTNVLEALGWPQ